MADLGYTVDARGRQLAAPRAVARAATGGYGTLMTGLWRLPKLVRMGHAPVDQFRTGAIRGSSESRSGSGYLRILVDDIAFM